MHSSKQYRWETWCLPIFLGFFFLKTLYLACFVTLPWDLPDEIGHLGYVQHIANGEGIPVFREALMDEDMWRSMVGPEGPPADYNWIAQHPPLYYVLMAPGYWIGSLFSDDFKGALYGVRLCNAVLMLVVLILVYRLALRFTDDGLMALCATVMVGSIPLVGQTAAGVSNDTLTLLMTTALAFCWLLFSERPNSKNLFVLGIVIGLCGITKYTMLLVMAPVTALVLWRWVQEHGFGWTGMAGFTALAWLPFCFWILRNLILIGRPMPTGLDHLSFESSTQYSLSEFFHTYPFFTHTFRSFWGIWGWLGVGKDLQLNTLHLPPSYQLLYALFLAVLAIASLIALAAALASSSRMLLSLGLGSGAVSVIILYLRGLFPHESYYVTWIVYLALFSVTWVVVVGIRGLWLTKTPVLGGRDRIQMESILVCFFFLALFVRQMHDYSNDGGALRGTHGRYFFASFGLLMIAWILPALRRFRQRGFVPVAVAAVMVFAEFWLLLIEVIPYLNRDV